MVVKHYRLLLLDHQLSRAGTPGPSGQGWYAGGGGGAGADETFPDSREELVVEEMIALEPLHMVVVEMVLLVDQQFHETR